MAAMQAACMQSRHRLQDRATCYCPQTLTQACNHRQQRLGISVFRKMWNSDSPAKITRGYPTLLQLQSPPAPSQSDTISHQHRPSPETASCQPSIEHYRRADHRMLVFCEMQNGNLPADIIWHSATAVAAVRQIARCPRSYPDDRALPPCWPQDVGILRNANLPLNLPRLSDATAATTEVAKYDRSTETNCYRSHWDEEHWPSPPKPHLLTLSQPLLLPPRPSIHHRFLQFFRPKTNPSDRFVYILVIISRCLLLAAAILFPLHQIRIWPRQTKGRID